MLNPLQNQQLASNPKNSVWVMASAGSGKTKVLTDRVLRILLSGVDPSKILCLTYTKVASVEMQKRIYDELQEWAICSPEKLAQKISDLGENNVNSEKILSARSLLAKNLDAEFKIKIQTIHSFCQSILKSFPFEAKIPLNFELLEENQAKILLKDCQKKILQNSFDDPILHDLIIKINSNTSDDTITKLISDLLNKKDKINFLKNKYHDINNIITQLFKKFGFDNQNIAENLTQILQNLINKLDLTRMQIFCKQSSNYGKKLANQAQDIQKFINNPDFDNIKFLQQGFFTKEGNPRKLPKLDDSVNNFLSAEFNYFTEQINDFNQQYQALKTIENSSSLLIIVDKILEEFQKAKISNGFVDYGDLINITNQMLQNKEFCDWIKLKMDSSFDHLLVDEAQDTNPVQWSIIKALIDDFFSGETKAQKSRSVFVVGDEKQSIMGFQGSNIDETKKFHDYLQFKSNYQLQDINLNVSFRSGNKILQLVDQVFANENFQNALCKIGTYNQHISYRNSSGYVEIWQSDELKKIIDEKNNNEVQKPEDNYDWHIDFNKKDDDDFKNIIAKFVAYKIKKWRDDGKKINDKNRELNYGDIMILVRNRQNGLIERLSHHLTKLEIPFASVGKIKFSEDLLIQDFLALARFALLPEDCFNLACLLKSPFFNIDEQQLLNFCREKNQRDSSLWHALQSSQYFQPLKNIIDFSKNNNCYEFYFKILNDKNNRQNIASRFGNEGLEIANNFLLICQDFSDKNLPILQKFLEFIEKIDPEINLNLTTKNQVKITTIHSSKGLQAPIVIMPDCLYQYAKQADNKINLLWDDDFPIFITKDADINNSLKELKERKIYENYEEHLRLLYVALTRAEDELYIGGLSREADDKSWYNIIASIDKNLCNKTQIIDVEADAVKKKDGDSPAILLNYANYNFNDKKHNFELVNKSLIGGENIHKILEIIGKNSFMPQDWLIDFVKKFINNNVNQKNADATFAIIENFIKSQLFSEIFKDPSNPAIFCEYEIFFNDKNLRIDLIKISAQDILIIDYKTDGNPEKSIPKAYIEQLNLYHEALQNLYPQHRIKSAILWLTNLKLQLV